MLKRLGEFLNYIFLFDKRVIKNLLRVTAIKDFIEVHKSQYAR